MSRRCPTSVWFFCLKKKCYLPSSNQNGIIRRQKNFLNRGCAVSVTSHYFILEYIVDHFPLYPVLDAVKHYTTWKDHLRILKASPNMYTNLRPMHSTVSCCHITLETTYTSPLLYEVTHSNNTFFHYQTQKRGRSKVF